MLNMDLKVLGVPVHLVNPCEVVMYNFLFDDSFSLSAIFKTNAGIIEKWWLASELLDKNPETLLEQFPIKMVSTPMTTLFEEYVDEAEMIADAPVKLSELPLDDLDMIPGAQSFFEYILTKLHEDIKTKGPRKPFDPTDIKPPTDSIIDRLKAELEKLGMKDVEITEVDAEKAKELKALSKKSDKQPEPGPESGTKEKINE